MIFYEFNVLNILFQVIVIDKGGIAEMGTHSELLALNGVYKRLVLRQLTSGEATSLDSNEEPKDQLKIVDQHHEIDSTDRLLDLHTDENIGGNESFINKGKSQMATIGDNLEDNVIDGEEDDLRNEKESDVNSDQAENDVGSGVR